MTWLQDKNTHTNGIDKMDKGKLYEDIEADDGLSDEEKREAYFAEIENDEAEEEMREE